MQVYFIGIDDWNRPVFKEVDKNTYIGSLYKLFANGTPQENVLEQITSNDLVYFGRSFGCEPLGETLSGNIEIISK